MHAFTIKSNKGLARVLISPISIIIPNTKKVLKTQAIWDTGATSSVVTEAVVKALGLVPTGMCMVSTANGNVNQYKYIVDIQLPNNVVFRGLTVTGVPGLSGGCEVLIGMDIISMGDLSITNHNGTTCMSFRLPSSHEIDYVNNPTWKHGQQVVKKESTNKFANIARNDNCPCGSGRKFKHCHDKK